MYDLVVYSEPVFYNKLIDLCYGRDPRQILKLKLKSIYGKIFIEDEIYERYLDFVDIYWEELYNYVNDMIDLIYAKFEEIFRSLLNIANRLVEVLNSNFDSLKKFADTMESFIDYGDFYCCEDKHKQVVIKRKTSSLYYMSTPYQANLNSRLNKSHKNYHYRRY